MSDRAGWEVEGFIDRLIKRDDTNSERLVFEAISHLRAFYRDCDALRTEIDRLKALIAECPVCSELERHREIDRRKIQK